MQPQPVTSPAPSRDGRHHTTSGAPIEGQARPGATPGHTGPRWTRRKRKTRNVPQTRATRYRSMMDMHARPKRDDAGSSPAGSTGATPRWRTR